MPEADHAVRLAAAAQHAVDRGYQVTAVASAGVAVRMVAGGDADVIVAASLDDLPGIEVAGPRSVIPRPRTSPDVVPPARRRPRRRTPGATRDAPGDP